MADNSRSQGFAAKEQKLQDKLDKLQSRYDKATELLEKPGGMDTSRMKGTNRLLSQINEVKQQLKDLKKARGDGSTRAPKRPPPLTDSGFVKPAPGSNLKDKGGAYPKFQDKEAASRVVEKIVGSDSSRPLIVDTKSKKPIAKRIMEALGDNRSMEQATRDRKMTAEMERETMGRKKGGMGQKKKAPVKKASGGMVKKKQGGSANKVNMKAGFTRRGCSKG
jgi:hypothetical protein